MYDDYYYYEEQRKAQAKSDAALAGTFAAGICGGIGIVFSVIMFLISRFDILSSALMALAGYILTYGIMQCISLVLLLYLGFQ